MGRFGVVDGGARAATTTHEQPGRAPDGGVPKKAERDGGRAPSSQDDRRPRFSTRTSHPPSGAAPVVVEAEGGKREKEEKRREVGAGCFKYYWVCFQSCYRRCTGNVRVRLVVT